MPRELCPVLSVLPDWHALPCFSLFSTTNQGNWEEVQFSAFKVDDEADGEKHLFLASQDPISILTSSPSTRKPAHSRTYMQILPTWNINLQKQVAGSLDPILWVPGCWDI